MSMSDAPLPAATVPAPLRRGDEIELTLTDFADRGKSLARVEGQVVFVAGAVPGDRVRARVFQTKKRHAEARFEELLAPSPLRVEPRCPYVSDCGGCKWQHVAYEAQLEKKRQSVAGALLHAGLAAPEVRPTLPSPRVFFYRNKMEFSFSDERWLTAAEIASGQPIPDTDAAQPEGARRKPKDFALGLHAPGSFAKVLDLDVCYLQSELSVRLVNRVRELAKAEGWAPYGQRSHTGFLRHLVIRHGEHTGETLVALVTNGWSEPRMARAAEVFRNEFPEVTTFVCVVHTGLSGTALGERTETIFGPGVLHDRIGDLTFEIAPNAFFQTNTLGAEVLYAVAREFADLRPSDLLYDLYCGAGTISLYCAPHVRHVVGVELVPEAIENAHANAARNGIANATFVAGDLLKLFTPDFVATHGRPDVLILDPPRAGVHPRVMEEIAALAPERLVYVSCNPQTQARDLALLGDGYRIEAVQPVDLFPHTDHAECVVRLVRV
jgi:23S rRNA (uracil1939-C5)-methyltransferase